MKKKALLAAIFLFCLPSPAQVSSGSVTARDLAGWYANHTIETGNVTVLNLPATVRKTPGVGKNAGGVTLSLYEIDIDKATFRLTVAWGIVEGKPLDYFAVQNVSPDQSTTPTSSTGRK
jgi:hypothetical protein